MIKLKITPVSIPYCIMKKKNTNSFKNNLLKEINLLETELDINPSASNLERFNPSKIAVEHIEKHETQTNVLRAQTSWTEDGERTQSSF